MKDQNLLPISIFLSAIILAGSIVYHAERLSGGSSVLSNSDNKVADVNVVAGDTAQPSVENGAPQAPQISKVSVDDDPFLGDKDAPVTLIEFSDYECPFCQRHFQQTHGQLISEYVDTGKVRYVFRDLPLSFHDPMATKAAMAANCVREQTGDEGYFSFHDSWFENTATNGSGLSDEKIEEYAVAAGANLGTFSTCLDSEKYKEEVQADLADAQSSGASATPSFFIGKSEGADEFEAEILVGAQPYSAFQTAIEKYLAE